MWFLRKYFSSYTDDIKHWNRRHFILVVNVFLE